MNKKEAWEKYNLGLTMDMEAEAEVNDGYFDFDFMFDSCETCFDAGYETGLDPWNMIPLIPVDNINEQRLSVFLDGRWEIRIPSNGHYNNGKILAIGYNCKPSRNHELRFYRNGKWCDGK